MVRRGGSIQRNEGEPVEGNRRRREFPANLATDMFNID